VVFTKKYFEGSRSDARPRVSTRRFTRATGAFTVVRTTAHINSGGGGRVSRLLARGSGKE